MIILIGKKSIELYEGKLIKEIKAQNGRLQFTEDFLSAAETVLTKQSLIKIHREIQKRDADLRGKLMNEKII